MNGKMTKQLRKIARDLQPVIKKVLRRYQGEQMLEMFPHEKFDQRGKPIEPKLYYMVKINEQVDHFEEIKKIYQQQGIQGVGDYVVAQNEDFKKKVLEH